jgi:soluble P-type ATPase
VGAVAQDTPLTSDFADILETWRSAGYTLAIVTVDGAARAVMSFADGIRPDATGFVSSLADLGVRVIMASGDHAQATETVAQNIGAEKWHSRLSPVDKAELVRTLQLAGHSVAFIGDGVNDAPALVQADLGVAMGSGADIAVQTGHFVLTRSDLTGVPKLFQLSRQVRGTIRVNLGWAISYNAVGLAAAAFGLALMVMPPPWAMPVAAALALATGAAGKFAGFRTVLVLAALSGSGAAGVLTALGQSLHHYPPGDSWPPEFNTAGLLAFVALLALAGDAIVEIARTRRRAAGGPGATGDPEPAELKRVAGATGPAAAGATSPALERPPGRARRVHRWQSRPS